MDQTWSSEPKVNGAGPIMKRKRGRPVASMHNATPEERRRVQVRLAQREFRNKEKNKIAMLEKHVEKLKSLAADMNCSFIRFRDRAVKSQSFAPRPELEWELEKTASQISNIYDSTFTTVLESGGDSLHTSSGADQPAIDEASSAQAAPQANHQTTLRRVPQTPPEASLHRQSTIDVDGSDRLPFGYRLTFECTEDDGEAETITTAATASPTIHTIQPPYTYSFNETTFANRLERATLERAAHVLSTVSIRPAEYQRLFRICRHFCDHLTLLSLFNAVLRSPVIKPFSALTLHLGGAGQHFASPGANGDELHLVPRTKDDNVRTVRATLEMLGMRSTPELEADVSKYEGVWFDSQDVERYLVALGVKVDAGASITEVDGEVLEKVFENRATSQGGFPVDRTEDTVLQGLLDGHCEMAVGYSSSVGSEDAGRPTGMVEGVEASVAVHITDELSEQEWNWFCDLSTPWLADSSSPLMETSAASPGDVAPRDTPGKRLIVDLEKFIKCLVRRAGCIGSGPGFHLEDIHTAFRSAVIGV